MIDRVTNVLNNLKLFHTTFIQTDLNSNKSKNCMTTADITLAVMKYQ